MHRIIKLGGIAALTFVATAAIALAAIPSGTYSGITQDDEEPITIEVGKKNGKSGKYVKDVFVEQSDECKEDLHFTKDDKIEGGKFKVKIRLENLDVTVATVKGEAVTEGIFSGTLKQVTCDGNEDPYTAYHETR